MADLDLKLKVEADTKNAEVNLKKTSKGVNELATATDEANKKSLSDLVVEFNKVTQATKGLASATKDFLANEIGINEAKESLKGFLVNATAGFLKLREAFSQEASFSQASRTIEGTNEQLKELNTTLNDLASTDLAVPIEDLNNVAGVAGAMGKSIEDIPAFVQTVSEGVVGLAIPAEDLAQKLGTLQTQLGLTEEGLVSLSDQVNSVADTLPGKVAEIDVLEVLSKGVATAGKNFGLLKGETIALAGSLLSLGEAPETARTGLVNLLSSLQNAKNQTPDFQEGLAAMGTSADQLAADIKAKPLPTLLKLLDTMHGMTNAGRLDIATKLLGKGQDAIALAKLVDNTTLLKSALVTATDATKFSGSVHEAYSKQIETASAKVTVLWNAIKNLSAGLVSTFLPVTKLAIDGFTGMVNAANRFSQNHPIIRTFAEIAGTILSLGGILRLFSFGLKAVGLLSPAVTARIAALGASFLVLGTSVSGATMALWTFIRTGSALSVVGRAISLLFGGTIGIAIGGIALLVTGIANLLPMTTKWGETTATVGEILAAMWKTVTDAFDPIIAQIGQGVDALNEWIVSLGIADGLMGLVTESLKLVGITLVSAGGLFKAFGETVGVTFAYIIDSAADFSNAMEDIFSGKGVGQTLDNYLANFSNKTAVLSETFSKIGSDAKNAFQIFEDATTKNLQKPDRKLAQKDQRAADTGTDILGVGDTTALKKQADEAAKIAKESQDRQIQIIRDAADERIRLYSNVAKSQQQIDAFAFNEKLLAEQKVNALIAQTLATELAATNKEATEKRAALISIEQATATQVKNLIALAQQHRDKAVGFLNEIAQQELNRTAKNNELATAGLSGAQQVEERKRQIIRDTATLKKLLADGEYAKAAELGKKLQDLAFQQAQATKAAAAEQNKRSAGTGDDNAALQSKLQYNAAVDLTVKALQASAEAEKKQSSAAQEEADKQKTALEKVRATIADIDAAITKGNQLKVSVDTSEVDTATQKINDIPKDVYTTIHTQTVEGRQAGGLVGVVRRAAGGAIPFVKRAAGRLAGFGGGDRIPLLAEAGEYVLNKFAVRGYGQAAIEAVNRGDASIAIKRAGGGPVNNQIRIPKIAPLNIPTLPANFNVAGNSGSKSHKTIDVNLSIGGASAVGTFKDDDLTAKLVEQLSSYKRGTR